MSEHDTEPVSDPGTGQGERKTPGARSYVTPPIPSALAPLSGLVDARTAEKRWGLTPELRRRVVACASSLLDSDNGRERVAAMRTLAMLDAIDAKRERTDSQASTADRVSARDVAARLLSTPEGRALAAAQAELLGAPPALQTSLEAPAEIQTSCHESDSGGVLERERTLSGCDNSPIPSRWGQVFTTAAELTAALSSPSGDPLTLLSATLGALPEPMAEVEQPSAYTTRPPDAAPPPAPVRRPSLTERRRRR